MSSIDNNNSISFQDVINVQYIRNAIFNQVHNLNRLIESGAGAGADDNTNTSSLKGSDIIKLPNNISRYGMSWDFIKHYLPSSPSADVEGEEEEEEEEEISEAIFRYCLHRNATLATLEQLIDKLVPNFDSTSHDELAEQVASNGNKDILGYASSGGHLDIIKFLHEYRSEGTTTNAIDNAANAGLLMLTEGATTDAIDFASDEMGFIEIVKFLYENRTKGATTNAIQNALSNNHLEIVKYLQEKEEEEKLVAQNNL
ncbi:hypothetical protein DFA_10112 [Cavenderia fasciculata]|uniref:Ankyrin repeat-containing protein n=1 Tax=Cavenderia fasciculata TaxID=261658 RepID=F4Q9A9_CACFS|nr:uncharacterized protein DFA_10112 [Cavenderia fasciculata]EGG15278.1 hypothetical protein DFA_10112 [Cavenderia fasciculata]|eukprot:XP_004351998.1 hypothetical protein DFA_10112 [Cavenderia fasciculata]